MQETGSTDASHSVTFTLSQTDSSEKQQITVPSEVLQKILLHLPLRQLLTHSAQQKRFDEAVIDPVRYVNKAFHFAVQKIMLHYPQLYRMATTEVGYNEALTRTIMENHHPKIPESDLPFPYNTMTQTQLYLKDLSATIVTVGQAAAHHLDSKAPIYCVDNQHNIRLYPMSQTDKSSLTPIAHFSQHQASLQAGTVITVNMQLVASGDNSGCIWLWQPSSHQPIAELTDSPSKLKKIKKEKKPLFPRLSRRKTKAKEPVASDMRQSSEKVAPKPITEDDYEPRSFHEHQYPITSMITIDHQRFMSCDDHGVIKLWHINETKSIKTWIAENHIIHSLSWSNGHCRFVSTPTTENSKYYQVSEIHGDAIITVRSILSKPMTENSEDVFLFLNDHCLVSISGRDHEATMWIQQISNNPPTSANIKTGSGYACRKNEIPFFTVTGGFGFFRPHTKRSEIEITQPLAHTSYHDVPAAQARFP